MDAVSGARKCARRCDGSNEENEPLIGDRPSTKWHSVHQLLATITTQLKQHISLHRIWYILLGIVIVTVLNSVGVLIKLTDTAPVSLI